MTMHYDPTLGSMARKRIDDYLQRLKACLADLPADQSRLLMSTAMARIELEVELEPEGTDEETASAILARLGAPDTYARHLRATIAGPSVEEPLSQAAPPTQVEATQIAAETVIVGNVGPCRSCGQLVSREAFTCPHCGAPWPSLATFARRAFGYEWKSKATLFGLPLVHVAYGRDKNGKMRVAKGIIAIGQFGVGVITIAQFGVAGLFGIGQFMLAPLALGQFAFGLVALGQVGIGALFGAGQIASGVRAFGQIVFKL